MESEGLQSGCHLSGWDLETDRWDHETTSSALSSDQRELIKSYEMLWREWEQNTDRYCAISKPVVCPRLKYCFFPFFHLRRIYNSWKMVNLWSCWGSLRDCSIRQTTADCEVLYHWEYWRLWRCSGKCRCACLTAVCLQASVETVWLVGHTVWPRASVFTFMSCASPWTLWTLRPQFA